jgi:hypothetical protein
MPNQVYSSSRGPSSGRSRRLMVIGGIIVLALLAIAFSFLNIYKKDSNNTSGDNNPKPTSVASDNSPTTPMSMAKNPTFITPNDMNDYQRQPDLTVSTAVEYMLARDESGCNLQFGVAGAEDLPGDTINEVALNHLAATADDGASIVSQTAGNDLILKDSTKNRRYVMQTVDVTFVRENVTYMAADSIAFLPGNKRIFVRRYCPNINGTGPTSVDFGIINDKVKEILVNTD